MTSETNRRQRAEQGADGARDAAPPDEDATNRPRDAFHTYLARCRGRHSPHRSRATGPVARFLKRRPRTPIGLWGETGWGLGLRVCGLILGWVGLDSTQREVVTILWALSLLVHSMSPAAASDAMRRLYDVADSRNGFSGGSLEPLSADPWQLGLYEAQARRFQVSGSWEDRR